MTFEISEASKRFWDLFIAVLTLAGAVAGGVFGIVQYLDAKHKDRVASTIEYLQRYDEAPLLDGRQRIDDALEIVRAEYVTGRSRSDRAANAALYNDLLLAKIHSDESLEFAIRNVIEFYEQLSICVDQALCDRDVAQKYFKSEATNVTNDVYPFVCDLRSRWHNRDYGARMAVFARGSDIGFACPKMDRQPPPSQRPISRPR